MDSLITLTNGRLYYYDSFIKDMVHNPNYYISSVWCRLPSKHHANAVTDSRKHTKTLEMLNNSELFRKVNGKYYIKDTDHENTIKRRLQFDIEMRNSRLK